MKQEYETLVAGAGVLQELTTRRESGWRDRLSGFLSLVRPLFFVLTPVNAAGAAVLALGGYPAFIKGLLGFIAVAFASCAVNVFNDYTDRERDRDIWPSRPIPSGRVRPGEALAVAAVSLSISLAIAWLAFNPLAFSILLLAIVLGGFYSAYLRDRVGYLSLPPIVGLIYLGGWAAFSPETLFGSVLPWYLYLLGVVWQAAHIMIYYPLHVVPGSGSRPDAKAPPVLFFTPSSQTAVKIGVVFTGLTLLLSAALFRLASLHVFYLVLVVAAGAYALFKALRLNKDVKDRDKGLEAFMSLSVFRLVISAAILLSVFLTQV
ncbi:MAG TPA: UbiA prenyltransferase family protein [Dehalococcoidales bacterium]|nr:UbiA prenyltransferase family protein [Dehalococcoidales bacterium]